MLSRRIALASLVLLLYASAGTAQDPRPGDKPYTPTRLEWLCLELNSEHYLEMSTSTGYGLFFLPDGDGKSVIIGVMYLPDTDRAMLNDTVEFAKDVVKEVAHLHGWDWVTVTERVKMSPSGKRKG